MSFVQKKTTLDTAVTVISTDSLSSDEHAKVCSDRARKKARKIKDGTDGIDACDERTEADRFDDCADYMRESGD